MSRAFVKEDARAEAELVPPRAPLPEGTPNLVTTRGWRLLHDERAELEADRDRLNAAGAPLDAVDERLEELLARIASAQVVAADTRDGIVRFGATVDVEVLGGPAPAIQRLCIVGVDEADPAAGRVAFVSPIARALLGSRVGEELRVEGAGGQRRWRITSVAEGGD